ncbi:MAG: hypothetical protein DCC67_17160 [Planctomycetota bacterium]|nr:MAG: hypothetical protein DCC67_17160 [Planctomycetota bacterium]
MPGARFPGSLFLAAAVALFTAAHTHAEPVDVQKTNPLKVFMHYMPWFESLSTLGGQNWGFHWQLANRNPNVVDANGRRQIGSHYYPLIGPYASRDADVIEYHLLLMKYAGIDGVLINWYGVQGSNGDIGSLLLNSNAIVNRVDDFGLQFAVVFEDRFARTIEDPKANVRYLRDNYFNRPEYVRHGEAADPLMLVFGPIKHQQPADWTAIVAEAGEDVELLPLWYESQDAGANADGEFAWIYENESTDDHLARQSSFLLTRSQQIGTAIGVAYPGFHDYYAEGGQGEVVGFEIPHNGGQTLQQTLALATTHAARMEMLQLATWNDFTEGTMFEPTVEHGFAYLRQVQQFTGVAYGEAELELVYRLFRARKQLAGNAAAKTLLDQASAHLAALQVASAQAVLEQLLPAGDFDGDGDADGADLLRWQRQLGAAGLYPLQRNSADANADGVVDAADLAQWRQSFTATTAAAASTAAATPASSSAAIPEPSAAALVVTALLAGVRRALAAD